MKRTLRSVLLVCCALLAPAGLLWAAGEEYAELDLFDLILGIIENPDPIAQVHYIPLDADPNDPSLRKPGERNDGPPAFEFDRATRDPLLTWAYETPDGYDVAFNEWGGADWDPKIAFVGATAADELDPRLYVDKMNVTHLVWWEDRGAGRVLLASRLPGGGWSAPVEVGQGRRPSVAFWDGDLVVAYERNRGGIGEVVFARRAGAGFSAEVVARTMSPGRLDPVVHARDGVLWIDWKHGTQSLAFARFDGGSWRAAQVRPWSDPSWVGELTARHAIEVELTQ